MTDKEYAVRYANAIGKALKLPVVVGSDDDDYLLEIDGWVYVSPADIEIPYPLSGAKTEEKHTVPGFVVEKAVRIPGGRWEPEDVDIVEVSEHRALADALAAAFLLVQSNTIQQVMQAEGESMWAEEITAEQV